MLKLISRWPRQPFVGISIAALSGILLADRFPHPSAGLSAAVIFALLALLRRSSLLTYSFVAAAFFALHSLNQTTAPGIRLTRDLGAAPLALAARGQVVSEPQISARGVASFHFQLESIQRGSERQPTQATIVARWRGEVQYGDALQLFGVVHPTEPPRNPGEFDMRAYLARRDIHQVMVVGSPENGKTLGRGGGNRIMRAAQASRNWMQNSLARGLEDSPDLNGLISGMVLGVREDSADEIEEQFQQTGTLHLFAVSGLNVAIVATLLWAIASAVRLPRKWAIGLIIPALFFYAAVTGLNASSIRAALMAAMLLGGFFFDRKLLSANSVAAAGVLVLCYDTNQLYSTGFQLSFAVVIAIFLFAQPIFRALLRWCEPDPFLPRSLLNPIQRLWQNIWRAIAGGASVSLAAWIGSLLFILPYFYLITPVSLFANLVVVPLAFFVLAFGLMSLLVIPIAPWLAIIFNNANWTLAAAILGAVGIFARAPAGHFYLELPHWPRGTRAEMTALDLGAGGAIHLRTRKSEWLIDCGSERDFKRIVSPYLRSRGVNHLDGLILSHGDSRHVGAATKAMRVYRPRQIIDTAAPDRSTSHRAMIAYFESQRIARKLVGSNEQFDLGRDVSARVLFPPANFKGPTADDQTLVLQLLIADRWRVLLMSDSGEATETALLQSGADLQSDIVIKGQHHSGNSGSAEFLERVRPAAIVASSLDFPESERLKEDWAAGVTARGIKLFRQDETGAVTLRFYRQRWEAIPFLSADLRNRNR